MKNLGSVLAFIAVSATLGSARPLPDSESDLIEARWITRPPGKSDVDARWITRPPGKSAEEDQVKAKWISRPSGKSVKED